MCIESVIYFCEPLHKIGKTLRYLHFMRILYAYMTQTMKAKKSRPIKSRVTTYLDRDVLMWLKVRSLELRIGYQTLLNRTLRECIERETQKAREIEVQPVQRAEIEALAAGLAQLEVLVREKRPSATDSREGEKRPRTKRKRRGFTSRRKKSVKRRS